MRVLPRRLGPGIGAAVLLAGRRQVQQPQEAADVVVLVADDQEAFGLEVEPALGDGRRRLALGSADQIEDPLAVVRARCLGIVVAPRVPVERRQDARHVPEEELQVEGRALALSPPRGLQAGVDVAAHSPE